MSAKNYWIPFDWARESLNVSRTTIRDIFQAWGLVVLQGMSSFLDAVRNCWDNTCHE
jgi:hypothetical protein